MHVYLVILSVDTDSAKDLLDVSRGRVIVATKGEHQHSSDITAQKIGGGNQGGRCKQPKVSKPNKETKKTQSTLNYNRTKSEPSLPHCAKNGDQSVGSASGKEEGGSANDWRKLQNPH